ncbi:FISUMP domain-containing protein [uncultured Fibrobacter sp.]|uniref:FISUMP domain-containing protein n=1 Tax=uncultured Fibrobacter sp. TaxID=261512 RepID=UPI0025F0BBE6|nr:FISUMP domain-containing protein [uncultured Fibrobacter sp.]
MRSLIFLILLSFAFSACSDDSGTSPNKESNTSEETSSDNAASSSSDKSSSSSKKDSSVSSSSANESSSSRKAVSSSSAIMSSSSRLWQPFNLADYADQYQEFTDSRNNRTYKYLKFEGIDTLGKSSTIYAMAENLNIGEMIWGVMDQTDDFKIERYCYDDDTLNCHYYGGLYQWAEMMQLPSECNTKNCADLIQPNHQGICPDGWRLLTYNDFYIVIHSNGNTHGVEGARSTFGFGGYNTTGFSLVGAGENWDYQFTNLNKSTYWFYPEESGQNSYKNTYASSQSRPSVSNPKWDYMAKTNGFSVRCVMDY